MKEQERLFFALSFNLWHMALIPPRKVVELLDGTIHYKRCWYYLKKWADLGFYEYGTTLDLGWFTFSKMPERYKELVRQVQPWNWKTGKKEERANDV